jgi:hypothetical protein
LPYEKQLDTLLLSFNLFSIIDFPTRSKNNSVSLIDNIFIDHSQFGKYLVYPMINGLSDHDAQLLIIKNICLQIHKHQTSTIRIFNKQSLFNFKMKLSYETWDDKDSINIITTELLFKHISENFPFQFSVKKNKFQDKRQ